MGSQPNSPLAALASKAALLAEQLGSGLYEGCAEVEVFPSMAETIRLKHMSWTAQLKKYGMLGENFVAPQVQAATRKLRDEETRLRKLHGSCYMQCYMQCFKATRFMFPKELASSIQGVIDTFDNLSLLLEDAIEYENSNSSPFFFVPGQSLDRGYVKLNSGLPDSDEDPQELLLLPPPKPKPRKFKSTLPFSADKWYVRMDSSLVEVQQALERRNGPHVVVLQGGPGTGKSSHAKHLALQYQEKWFDGSRSPFLHFVDGIFYLDCSGGMDIKAKQLELLHILEYPLQRLLTSGESQHLSRVEIHKRLVEHMEDKDALLFLDNVADSDLLQHLLVPSKRVKYLVTSELQLLWADTLNLRMPPLPMDVARRILSRNQYLDVPSPSPERVIPSHIQRIADSLITATGANPLALASLSLAVGGSRGGTCTDAGKWEQLEAQFRRQIVEQENNRLIPVPDNYPRHVGVPVSMAIDQLPKEAKSILFAVAAFDDLPIPEVMVRLLVKCTDGSTSRFSMWRDFLSERGFIQQLQQRVPWSQSQQSTLSIHGIRKHCVTSRAEIGRMIDGLLNRLPVRNQWKEEGLSTDAVLMSALFVVYGEGELAVRAAARLGVSDFSHMGNLILTWLAPLVSLLRVVDDHDEWQQHFHMTHILARQVILEFVCHGNPENGMTGLLALPESALTACWALAVNALDKPVVIANESILRGLLSQLGKNVHPATQRSAAWALTNILVSNESKRYNFAKFPGFLEGFVRLLGPAKDTDDEIQSLAAWALMVVAEAEENRVEVAAFPGALPGLVRMLSSRGQESLSDKSDTQSNAAWALANLTVATENKVTIATRPGALQGLVRLLGKDVSPCTQGKAAWALANMAEAQENKVRIALFPGALRGLVRLLSVNEYDHGLYSAPHHSQERLVAARALSNLNAAWALASLSDAHENRVSIAKYPGLLRALVRLLNKDVNSQTRCSAAWAIVHLAGAAENKSAIVSMPGALEGLVGLLDLNESVNDHETTWTWRNLSAAWALGSLADREENKARIAACPGVFKGLVGLLCMKKNVNIDIQSRAAWALANISGAGAHQEALAVFPGALHGFVGLLGHDVNSQTQSNATRALAHIVEARKNRVLVTKFPGALEGLVRLLGKDESACDTQNNAARALATMATVEENQIAITGCPGALEGLVRLLGKSENPAVQINAGWALANLAESPVNKIKISAVPGAVEVLLELLEEDVEAFVQAVAARTLTQIAANTSNQLLLRSAEAYRSRAMINIEMENYSQALSDLNRAFKLQPDNAHTFSWRRFVRVMLKDFKGALRDANKAIALKPQQPFHWLERGVLKRMMGNLHGALADLSRGLVMNPGDYETLKHRAYVKYLMHDEAGACTDAEQAIAARPAHLDDSGYGAGFLAGFGVEFLVYKLK